MQIRVANREDIEQLRRLYFELETDGVKYQPEHFIVGYRSDDFFDSIFRNDDQDILVADVDGTVIGFSHVIILYHQIHYPHEAISIVSIALCV